MLRGRGMSSREIVLAISPLLDRVVTDRTGLDGAFDFELTWASGDLPVLAGSVSPRPPAVEATDTGPPLVTALREQLGLRLEPQRGQVDVLVVDSAERPTPD